MLGKVEQCEALQVKSDQMSVRHSFNIKNKKTSFIFLRKVKHRIIKKNSNKTTKKKKKKN
jgi:hypothetical protein